MHEKACQARIAFKRRDAEYRKGLKKQKRRNEGEHLFSSLYCVYKLTFQQWLRLSQKRQICTNPTHLLKVRQTCINITDLIPAPSEGPSITMENLWDTVAGGIDDVGFDG
jgi:hypothetical protein